MKIINKKSNPNAWIYSIDSIPSMRNPSVAQMVTITQVVTLTQIVTPFWASENITIMSGTISYTRTSKAKVKLWLRQVPQLLTLAVTCISTVLLALWISDGTMRNYLEKIQTITTLKLLVRFRIQWGTLEQQHHQALIKCGSIRQPVATRPSPEKWSTEKDRSANKLNFQAVGWDTGVPFSFNYFLNSVSLQKYLSKKFSFLNLCLEKCFKKSLS